MYSCFYGSAGVETCLFMNAILVNQDDVLGFAEAITEKSNADNRVANPTDWYGGIHSSCYITPKEVCWFSWKARYDSANIEEFPQFELKSAVDDCCYNSPEYGDVYFYLPSAPIRDILGIVDSDGYLFFDNSRKVIAEHSIAGEKWRTYQNYVIVDRPVRSVSVSLFSCFAFLISAAGSPHRSPVPRGSAPPTPWAGRRPRGHATGH